MTAPFLVPCLVVLRAEFNTEAPNRDKGSDGWIGDAAHQQEVSDHNPDAQGRVLAVDIDSTGPFPIPFDDYVGFLVDQCQNDLETRLEYIIRNRKIYERKNGFAARDYTGSDPHTGHAHFSARHDHTGQNDEGTWFMLSNTDKTFITTTIRTEVAAVAAQVWRYELDRPDSTTTPKEQTSAGAYQRYTDVVTGAAADRVIEALTPKA
jgi:hypothetical protein